MPSLKSNRVVTPEGVRKATVRFEEGIIVDIGQDSADDDYVGHVRAFSGG